MIPHFPGKIRAPPPRRTAGALQAPYGRPGAPPSTGSFLLIKHTHTRARVRACVCVGASVRGRRRLWADGRRASGAWAPLLGGALWAPRPRGCSLGLSKGALQALCCARALGAPRALVGRSSGARGALLGRSSGAPQARARGARWGAPRALVRRFQARARGARWGARRALIRRSRGARFGRSSGALQALIGRFGLSSWNYTGILCFASPELVAQGYNPKTWAFIPEYEMLGYHDMRAHGLGMILSILGTFFLVNAILQS